MCQITHPQASFGIDYHIINTVDTDIREDEIDLREVVVDDNDDMEIEQDEDQEDQEDMDSKPLFAGASITLLERMLLILTYSMKHQLTGFVLVDLLVLISLHCLASNLCMTSLFLFNKSFQDLQSWLTDLLVLTYWC